MSTHGNEPSDEAALVSNRSMDIVVALLFIALSAVFVVDSWRIGAGWIEGQGPAPGSFPFYIGLIMGGASLINLYRAVASLESDGDATFVTRTAFARVLLVLVPTLIYVLAIQYLGIYVASAIFILGFMLVSREGLLSSIAVGLGAPLALFMMFEKWFLVPLPKGPLEAMLGL